MSLKYNCILVTVTFYNMGDHIIYLYFPLIQHSFLIWLCK